MQHVEQGYLLVGLYIPNEYARTILRGAINNMRRDRTIYLATSVYLVSTPFFSYEPILSRLQGISSIPFTNEIVNEVFSTNLNSEFSFSLSQNIENALKTDTSQLIAAKAACTSPITLIQGPPGTGKTYIGVQLAKAIIESVPNAKILCLCYTNHALDSFLESLIENGIKKTIIKRIGYSPKIADAIKPLCLNSRGRKLEHWEYRRYCEWKEELQRNAQTGFHLLKHASIPWDEHSFRYVKQYLEDKCMDDELRQLSNIDYDDEELDDGWERKTASESATYQRWLQGKYVDQFGVSMRAHSLWRLNKYERKQLLLQWYNSVTTDDVINDFIDVMDSCHNLSQQIIAIEENRKVTELCTARILACTTSGAASSHRLIKTYAPTHIIIEEAAEILEAHVLSNLTESVQQ
jgi:DNA polymerase III delta prime subunit